VSNLSDLNGLPMAMQMFMMATAKRIRMPVVIMPIIPVGPGVVIATGMIKSYMMMTHCPRSGKSHQG